MCNDKNSLYNKKQLLLNCNHINLRVNNNCRSYNKIFIFAIFFEEFILESLLCFGAF